LRPNQEKPSPPVLRPNWKKLSQQVLRPNRQKLSPSVLRPNRRKPSPPVLRPNWRKLSQWFCGQSTHKPSTMVSRLNQETHAPSLHVSGAGRTRCHPTSRPPDHQVPDLCGHLWSSTPGLLLLPQSLSLPTMPHLPPAQHETSKRDSSTKQR
jgi:hypothetical protein